jgi:CHRD domain
MKKLYTACVVGIAIASLPQVALAHLGHAHDTGSTGTSTASLLLSQAEGISFTSVLNGAQEVPAVSTPGFGSGKGLLTGGPGSYVFSYEVDYSGLRAGVVNPPGAHIHVGAVGTNGPVFHFLDNLASQVGRTEGKFVGDWRFDDATQALTDDLAQSLLDGNTYFNIHTSFSRPGEIRGQIERTPEPATLIGLGVMGGLEDVLKVLRGQKLCQSPHHNTDHG